MLAYGEKVFSGPGASREDIISRFGHNEKLASKPAARPGGLPDPKFLERRRHYSGTAAVLWRRVERAWKCNDTIEYDYWNQFK